MEPIIIIKALPRDVPGMREIIMHYADKHKLLPRSLNELYESVRDFYVIKQGDKVLGSAALHVDWADLAEIKALTVSPDLRGQGYGLKLIEQCLIEAKQLGIPKVFALTYVTEFFKKLGFVEIDFEQLPRKIWGECVKCTLFGECDEKAMMYTVE